MRDLLSILTLFRNKFNTIKQEHMNVRFYLSHDIKITLNFKSHFWRKKVTILSFYKQSFLDIIS